MQLTQKEKDLLKDLKSQEQLCIDKYTRHAECAKDPQLKNLFSSLAQVEQGHLNILEKIESGSQPEDASAPTLPQSFEGTYTGVNSEDKQSDNYLCSDALAVEKHASALYDTSVFEFTDACFRNALNKIQTQEQNHGKLIYDYMTANGMSA